MLDVELRQAPLFSEAIRWCSNLAAPDMLLDWSGWMPSFIQGFLGPYLNILPIVTIFLFLLQQKLFMPPPTTEQAAMQQKIMKFMMIFIGFLFYKVAAALCIYFIASSVWGILERKLMPRPVPQLAGAAAAETVSETKLTRAPERPRAGRNGQPPSKAKIKTRRKK
jgi:YidC/Oxa1 family membrane protein insertase